MCFNIHLCLFSCLVRLFFCVYSFCSVLCIVSPFVYSCLFPIFEKFTDCCHRVGSQLQSINIIISYHIIYHISYHIISYHIISYHIISYHIISYHIISYHNISYHTPYHTISYISYIISYRISYHIISYHIISYIISYIVPYHIISYINHINKAWAEHTIVEC